MADTDTFAARLKSRREAAGLTQRQLAAAAGVPQTTIASLEAGDARSPRADVLFALADALATAAADLYPRPTSGAVNPCVSFARLGFRLLLERAGGPTDDEGDNEKVREILLSERPEPIQGKDGVRWLGELHWPDRVPGLKTWSGQQTLAKLIRERQKAVEDATEGDLFALKAYLKGTSGLDADVSTDALDVGFSPDVLGLAVEQRPALELLAVVGAESVPLVSFGRRVCGWHEAGRLWRFRVAPRGGDTYYHRWTAAREWPRGEGEE